MISTVGSRKLAVVAAGALVLGLAGCASQMQLGGATNVAGTGSAGDAGAQGGNPQLVKCSEPVGTVAIEENPSGYSYIVHFGSLPRSPVPLLKLMVQQTGCFRIVDRGAGLRSTQREIQLQQQGMVRRQQNVTKGNVVEAHYTIIPDIIFSDQNAGGLGAGLSAFGGRLGGLGAVVGGMKFREAQALLTFTDNNTTEQIAAAEGNAKATDFGLGGALLGTLSGVGVAAGVGGWSNTNEGKVVAAALMDAVNKLVPQVRAMGPAGAVPAKRR